MTDTKLELLEDFITRFLPAYPEYEVGKEIRIKISDKTTLNYLTRITRGILKKQFGVDISTELLLQAFVEMKYDIVYAEGLPVNKNGTLRKSVELHKVDKQIYVGVNPKDVKLLMQCSKTNQVLIQALDIDKQIDRGLLLNKITDWYTSIWSTTTI